MFRCVNKILTRLHFYLSALFHFWTSELSYILRSQAAIVALQSCYLYRSINEFISFQFQQIDKFTFSFLNY